MATKGYRLLQLTNSNLGAVAEDAMIPVGIMTRQVTQGSKCQPTFAVTTSANNALYINEEGFYKITYTAYVTVAAAGTIEIELQINGTTMQTATVTVAAAGTYLVSFVFMTRAYCNCNNGPSNLPVLIQLENTGLALTGGTSNLILERVN